MSANSFCILFALVVNALLATAIFTFDLLPPLDDVDAAPPPADAAVEVPLLAPRLPTSTASDDDEADPFVTALLTVVGPGAEDLFDC